jgi:hypothetical protein
MKRVCAWCNKLLGTVDSDDQPKNSITHGICPACIENFFLKKVESLEEFLNRLNAPILLIEPEPIVITANKQACEILGKDLSEIRGHKGGDVIECAYAKLPGGCGNQQHCKSCTIRITALETFATGKSFLNVPAYPDIQQFSKIKKMEILISTEKVGDLVVLRIDSIKDAKEI